MADFNTLPNELYIALEPFITSCGDLAALARCTRRLHTHFHHSLYKHAASTPCGKRALFWSAANGEARTFHSALSSETDINILWRSEQRIGDLRELVPSAKESKCSAMKGQREGRDPRMPRWRNDFSWSLVHVAAANGNTEILETLLKRSAELNLGCLGLCKCDRSPRVLGGAQSGAGFRTPSRSWTPLHVALCRGNTDAAKLLVSHGFMESMAASTVSDNRAFGNAGLVPLFGGANANANPGWGGTNNTGWGGRANDAAQAAGMSVASEPCPMHAACISGDLTYVKWLMDTQRVVNVNAKDCFGQTALCYAYLYHKWDCFEYLLGKGADINVVLRIEFNDEESWNETMLLDAIGHLRFSDARRLISLGADIDFVGGASQISVMCHLCAKLLGQSQDDLPAGADLLDDLLSRAAATPCQRERGHGILTHALTFAAGVGNMAAMRRLIDNGASVDGLPTDEKTPLVSACGNFDLSRRVQAITLLLDNGASPNPHGQCKQGPIWALCSTGANEDDPLHKEAFELLMSRGAKPYRGTSDLMTTFTTPLENLLFKQDIAGFDKLLERCGGSEVLGMDDILSFWNTVAVSENIELVEKVILMDREGAIARHARSPIQSLLSMKPIPAALVTRLLEQGATPDAPMALSTIHQAIFRGAELDLIKQLLDSGANPNAMVAKQPVLSHVISTNSNSLETGRKIAIVDLLLEAGVSIYDHLHMSEFFSLPNDTPYTHLGHVIHRKRGNETIVQHFLEHQPLADRRDNEVFQYLKEACRQGHKTALEAILSSAPGVAQPILTRNINLLTHLLLDNTYSSHIDGTEVNAAIDCLKILLQTGGNEVLDTTPPGVIRDKRTAREKLLALMVVYSGPYAGKMAMVSGCFQRRLDFKDGDAVPKFKSGWD